MERIIGFALGAVLSAGAAEAAPVDLLPTNTSLGVYLKTLPSGISSEKVYLDKGNGTLIQGHVGKQTGLPGVEFLSPSGLKAANGFAQISPQSGTFHTLSISVPGFSFTGVGFSTSIAELNNALDLTISAYSGADLLGSLLLLKSTGLQKNSNQSWYLLAEGSAAITSIVLESTSGLKQLSKFLLSGLLELPPVELAEEAQVSQNPLPAAAWLFGTIVFGGLGASAWRRRRKTSAPQSA